MSQNAQKNVCHGNILIDFHCLCYVCSLKKQYKREQKKVEDSATIITQLTTTMKEQTELLTGDNKDNLRSEVIKQLRLLNQRLPTMIEQNQEISSDVKAIFKDWGNTSMFYSIISVGFKF